MNQKPMARPSTMRVVVFVGADSAPVVSSHLARLSGGCEVLLAATAPEAMAMVLGDAGTAAIVCQYRPLHHSLELLEAIRRRNPQVRRVLLIDPLELSAIVEVLHTGTTDRVVHMPVQEAELVAALTAPLPDAHWKAAAGSVLGGAASGVS